MIGAPTLTMISWQKSKDLAVYIYKVTGNGKFRSDFALRDQLRRAAISIPSNIAEGDERETDKENEFDLMIVSRYHNVYS